MRKRINDVRVLPLSPSDLALAFLCGCFLIGYLAAVLLIKRLGEVGTEGALLCLSSLLSGEAGTPAPGRLALLWGIFRWPVLLILLRFTPAGRVAVPVLFSARGFLLTFSIGMFATVLPGGGLLVAFILFGLSELLQLPVFFLLGTRSLLCSAAWKHSWFGIQAQGSRGGLPLFRCGVCAAALLGAACLEYRVIPMLFLGLVSAGIC